MEYLRIDGRLPNEIRDIIISFDGLCGVDGSARFGFGDTKALASLSGPMEVRLAAEQANKATFEVFFRPLSGIPGVEAKSFASSLRTALLPCMNLTNNPRTLLQLVAQSLVATSSPYASASSIAATSQKSSQQSQTSIRRFGPSTIAVVINSSTLALLNGSSVPLKGVVCAASVGRVKDPKTGMDVLVVDPSKEEQKHLNGSGVFAFLITGGKPSTSSSPIPDLEDDENCDAQLVWSSWNAMPFYEEEAERAKELAKVAAFRVRAHMRQAIAQMMHGGRANALTSEETRGKEPDDEQDDVKMEIS